MPAQYESLGVHFLYPDNWIIAQRDATEGINGVTFELPSGGFFSIERSDDGKDEHRRTAELALIQAIEDSIAEDYGEVEKEELRCEIEGDRSVEFRFYYLDLMIISRLILSTINDRRFVIQIQAESRAFEENEKVFEAIFMQLQNAT